MCAHVAGDPNAFTTLVTRHQDRLWTIAIRIMRNPEDAADALQDAYIAAFRKAGSYRGDAQVTTWLHRVVVNACLDRLRTMRSRETVPLPEDLDRWSRMGTTLIKDPVEIKEQRRVVAAALGALNPDQRAALVLVDMEGYSVEEAAQIWLRTGHRQEPVRPWPGALAATAHSPQSGGGFIAWPIRSSSPITGELRQRSPASPP
ncbi:MAG TPA: RNA polymerase sigma factor SigM [Propionibacteriaceae bacterium]